jgi:EmrB/QacA subfamily drug resistance transporter
MTTNSTEQAAPLDGMSRRRRAVVAFSVSLVMVMATVEATVVVAVLPAITRELGSFHLYRWIVSAYMLASAMLMPVFGRLADSHGRRPTFVAALLLFVAGSAASGAASTMQILIAFRVIQGFGAGGLLVLAYTILGDIYTPSERARIQGILAALWSAAGAAGPLLGALILRVGSWRWAFYVNVPIGILVWILTRATYVDSHVPRRHGFDLPGALLLSSGIGGLLLSVGEHFSMAGLMISFVLVVLFVFQERKTSEPLLPLELLRRPLMALSCLTDFARIAAGYGTLTYLPLIALTQSGGNSTTAGLVLIPVFVGVLIGSTLGGQVVHYVSLRRFTQIALWIYTGATIANAWLIASDGSTALLRTTLVLFGVGMSAGSLALVLMVQSSVSRSELGTATGALTLARYIGAALGVGLLGSLLTSGAATGDVLTSKLNVELLLPLRHIFLAIACVALAGALTTLFFPLAPKLTALPETIETTLGA